VREDAIQYSDGASRAAARRLVLATVLTGVLWRLGFLLWTRDGIEADEAVVGLMARHILHNGEWPIWYYGQKYMGALEAYVAVPFVAVLGGHRLAIKLTALLFAVVYLWLAARLAVRTSGVTSRAWMTSLYLAFGPAILVLWTLKLRGGFVSTLALGHGVLLLAWVMGAEGATVAGSFALGFVAGVATWVNFLVFPFIAAAGVYLLSRRQVFTRVFTLLAIIAGFALGSLPLWLDNVRHDSGTVQWLKGAPASDLRGAARKLFGLHVPSLLGMLPPWWDKRPVSPWFWLTDAALALLLLIFLWRERQSFLRFVSLSRSPTSGAELYVLTAVFYIAADLYTQFGAQPEPRYSIVLYTLIAPMLGSFVGGLWDRGHVWRVAGSVLAAGIVGLSGWSIYGFDRPSFTQPTTWPGTRISNDWTPLYKLVEREHVDAIRADYWIGYPTAFETEERVIAVPGRYDGYTSMLEQERAHHAWVFRNIPSEQGAANRISSRLKWLDMLKTDTTVDIFRVVIPTDRSTTENWSATASPPGDHPERVFDHDVEERWTSSVHQQPGQWFRLDTGKLQDVAAVAVAFDSGDEPERVQLESSVDDRTWTRVTEAARPPANWRVPLAGISFRYLRMMLTKSRPRWWSIQEIALQQADAAAHPLAGAVSTPGKLGQLRSSAP
jgi:hypothetical protein